MSYDTSDGSNMQLIYITHNNHRIINYCFAIFDGFSGIQYFHFAYK